MKAISNALKGVNYHNPQLGESLYELCRRATSRHIDRPDEIINQQVVYMINSEMHTPYAAKDAATCLKRRLQMDHPQKQYLAIILTSKVLQECHAAIGIYQGELLQEVAYILRTLRSSGPASARTRQVAMDVLRHFGSAGGDAYRQARQQAGVPVMAAPHGRPDGPLPNRDPAAVAAERASLLDEIKRMCEQASASTEILNELILNKQQASGGGGDDSVALRGELLADAKELRKLFDLYMEQLAALQGADAEEAMKAALEAVDSLDNALTLDKDVDAELKDLQRTGQLPPPAAATAAGADAAGSSAAAAATAAAADSAAATVQSLNLIDLDDEPPAAPPAAAAAGAAAVVDPFAPPVPAAATSAGGADPFAPAAQSAAAPAAADPFAPAAAADPFAALAAGASTPAAQAYPTPSPAAVAAAAADPFADAAPAWGAPGSAAAVPAPAAGGLGGAAPAWGAPSSAAPPALAANGFGDAAPAWGAAGSAAPPAAPAVSTPLQQTPSGGGVAAAVSGGGVSGGGASAGGASGGGTSGGGYPPAAAVSSPYGAPVTPGYHMQQLQGGMAMQQPGMSPYGMPAGPYGMSPYGGGVPGQMPPGAPGMYMMGPQPTGMQAGSPYPLPAAAPSPYAAGMGMSPYPAAVPSPYPAAAMMPPQQQQLQQQPLQMPLEQQQQQVQQQLGGFAAPSSAPVPVPAAASAAADASLTPVLSPTNPFASIAPSPAAAGVANPFQPVPAAGPASNVDQEWNTFFSDSRPGAVTTAK